MSDIEFIDGLMFRPPVTKDGRPLPDFIKAKASIKVADLIAYLQTVETEWLNFDVKESKKGNWYAAVDNWTPTKDKEYADGMASAREATHPAVAPPAVADFHDDDIPW
jgi:hypothetical protein